MQRDAKLPGGERAGAGTKTSPSGEKKWDQEGDWVQEGATGKKKRLPRREKSERNYERRGEGEPNTGLQKRSNDAQREINGRQ